MQQGFYPQLSVVTNTNFPDRQDGYLAAIMITTRNRSKLRGYNSIIKPRATPVWSRKLNPNVVDLGGRSAGLLAPLPPLTRASTGARALKNHEIIVPA